MRARSQIALSVAAVLAWLAVPLAVSAQTGQAPTPPAASPPAAMTLSMDDAVRLAIEHNQSLRALRLTIDESKADETTAALKPNPSLSLGANGFTLFSPQHMNWSFLNNSVTYSAGLDYNFERGGKRLKRLTVAQDTTDVTARGVEDAERQLRFQTEQAVINVLLAKSTLDLAEQDLKSFSDVVEINQRRVTAGDLAEGDFYKIVLQKLQFEQDVSSAELGIIQAKATLRQLAGFDSVPEDFDVAGELAYTKRAVTLDTLKAAALQSRPDYVAAQRGLKLAQDQVTLELSNRVRNVDGNASYARTGPDSNTFAVGVAVDLLLHDKNQGNIAHAQIAVRQATETEAATRATVLTDVISAFAEYQTNEKIVALYQSGYLDQAKQSLDISTYVFQRGAGNLLDLLDAERTYRATELAFRQALAAYMTSVQQLNFVVGKQVIP